MHPTSLARQAVRVNPARFDPTLAVLPSSIGIELPEHLALVCTGLIPAVDERLFAFRVASTQPTT